MENAKLNNNFVNNNGKEKGTEFDAFLKSLLHHNKSKKNRQNQQNKNIKKMSNSNTSIHHMINNNYSINLKKSAYNNNLLIGNNSNSFINPLLNENTNDNKLSKNTRNTKMLYETFSNKNFLTLDQLIELNNGKMKNSDNNNNAKIENKYNSVANINWNSNYKSKTYNKSYEKLLHFNSDYNLILSNQFNLLNKIKNENENNIFNIKKIQIEKKKFKNKHNLSSTKLFRTFDKNNTIFSQKDYQENILSDGNNIGQLISSFKNNLKESEKDDRRQIIKNKNKSTQILLDKKNNKNNVNHTSKDIIYEKEKNKINNNNNTFDKIKNNNLLNNLNNNIINIINKKKINKNKRNIMTNKNILQEKYNRLSLIESSMYKKKNHSSPNNLNFVKVNKINDKNNSKNRNKGMKINKSNITMNNNYIFNNIQTKYNLNSFFNKKEKLHYNKTNNNNSNLFLKSFNDNDHKKSRNKLLGNKSDIINKTYNFDINRNKYKIIKVASFYYKNKKDKYSNKNILLNDISEVYDKKIILFFIKIINVYKNILLTQKKKEKLLLDEIIEKNNEIKKIKYDFLKMIYYFELEKKNKFDNSKNIFSKQLMIEKQLLEENKYLRNLTVCKSNIYSNFYSSYEGSCEGLLNIMEKEFNNINNNNIKNNIKNSKNGTANNSPKVAKRHYIINNDFLFINRKKKFRNFYIKQNKKEIQ